MRPAGMSEKSRKPSGCQIGPSVNWKPVTTNSGLPGSINARSFMQASSALLASGAGGITNARGPARDDPRILAGDYGTAGHRTQLRSQVRDHGDSTDGARMY